MTDEITLATKTDTFHFVRGMPLCMDPATGRVRRWRWYTKLGSRIWKRITWWRQPRYVVTAIDQEHGTITTARMEWSWRRWKWEAP